MLISWYHRNEVKSMVKKVTIRDVAREAGVSVATVSYVLNNRSDQKISAETKKKVLQIANLLQFTPSYAAKILTTGKSNIIGILPGRMPALDFFHIYFINCLIRELAAKGYKAMIFPSLSETAEHRRDRLHRPDARTVFAAERQLSHPHRLRQYDR